MVRLLSFTLASLSLVACAAGGPDRDTDQPSGKTSSSKDGTEPSKDTTSGDTASEGSSLGPQCEAYLECCTELAEAQPALAGSCDSTRSSIESAQEKGASTASYESSCKSALASARSAGYCE